MTQDANNFGHMVYSDSPVDNIIVGNVVFSMRKNNGLYYVCDGMVYDNKHTGPSEAAKMTTGLSKTDLIALTAVTGIDFSSGVKTSLKVDVDQLSPIKKTIITLIDGNAFSKVSENAFSDAVKYNGNSDGIVGDLVVNVMVHRRVMNSLGITDALRALGLDTIRPAINTDAMQALRIPTDKSEGTPYMMSNITIGEIERDVKRNVKRITESEAFKSLSIKIATCNETSFKVSDKLFFNKSGVYRSPMSAYQFLLRSRTNDDFEISERLYNNIIAGDYMIFGIKPSEARTEKRIGPVVDITWMPKMRTVLPSTDYTGEAFLFLTKMNRHS